MPGEMNDRDDLTGESSAEGMAFGSSTSREIPEFVREDLHDEWDLRGCEWTGTSGFDVPLLGEYPLLRRIGRGGMGVVYAGLHPRLGTEVAVKLLRRDIAARDETMRKRFLREARLAARLSTRSQHLVLVHDVNFDKGTGAYFLVMEYVHGISAQRWLKSQSEGDGVSETDALTICLAATEGLSIAHQAGVIHRDLKPDNVLIPTGPGGPRLDRAKLSDLGLARPDDQDSNITQAQNALVGTVGYAAPEQLESSAKARKAADVFGMGATLYALLVGNAPFRGDNPMGRAVATLEGRYVPIEEAREGVSTAVATLVGTCLRRKPEERFPDAVALKEAMQLCFGVVTDQEDATLTLATRVDDLVNRSEVGKSVLSTFASKFQSGPAGLALEGGPPRAEVHLESADQGAESSYSFHLADDGHFETGGIAPGNYELVARHPDFHEFRARVQLRRGAHTHVVLGMREQEGWLAVDSNPPGAVVVLDGAEVGATPVPRVPVRAGVHQVRIEKPGYAVVQRTVRVHGGAAENLGTIALAPRSVLSLAGFPQDVRFALGATAVADGAELEPGSRTLVARRPGYEPQEIRLIVAPGQTVRPALDPWRPNAWALMSELVLWRAASPQDRTRAAQALASGLDSFAFKGLESFSAAVVRFQVALFEHVRTGLEFVLLPGDTFTMGSAPDETGRRSDERSHRVTLSPYLIGRTPVTQAAWEATGRENPSHFHGADLPVERITWDEALEFAKELDLSLPTEAQWEYACRGGSAEPFCFGGDPASLERYGWFEGNSEGQSRPVGRKRPNALGLHDTHGAVWEWCGDCYGEYPFDHVMDPTGPAVSLYRVFRGGSWSDGPAPARSASRGAFRPDHRFWNLGMRLARGVRREDVRADGGRTQEVALG